VEFGVAGAVTVLQEDFVGELAGQVPYARSATSLKRPLGCKEQVPAVAGTLGEGDSDRAAGAGGPGAGCA